MEKDAILDGGESGQDDEEGEVWKEEEWLSVEEVMVTSVTAESTEYVFDLGFAFSSLCEMDLDLLE